MSLIIITYLIIKTKRKNLLKKKEKNDFYEINEDLYIFKDLKRKKIK